MASMTDVNVSNVAFPLTGGLLYDGPIGGKSKTLFVGVRPGSSSTTTPGAPYTATTENATFAVSALQRQGGRYLRYFQLSAFQQVRIDCSTWIGARIELNRLSAVGLYVYAMSTDEVLSGASPESVGLIASVAAGTWGVPPGAVEVSANVAVPSWSWTATDPGTGAAAPVADVVGLATNTPVKGPLFSHAEPGAPILAWRVIL